MKLMDGFDSNYRFVLVAARRARQIQGTARPSAESKPAKACRVAQDEVAAGKVGWEITPLKSAAVESPLQIFGDTDMAAE